MAMTTKEQRLQDATVALGSWARDFSGRYLLRLDSLRPEESGAAFERLKEAARQFHIAEQELDRERGDEQARIDQREALSGRS